jgi:hypothetical protein
MQYPTLCQGQVISKLVCFVTSVHQDRVLRSVVLWEPQAREIWNARGAIEASSIRLLRHGAGCQSISITPLRGRLRLPRPVEPTPAVLERSHLRLGEHEQPLLVLGRIGARVSIGLLARTSRIVLRGTGWVQDAAVCATTWSRSHI